MVRVVSANATGVSIVNSQMRSIVEAQHTHTRARAHTYTHTLCPRCRFRLTTKKFAYFEREGGEELGAAPIHTITTITLLSSDKEFLLTTVQPFTKSGQYEVCICAWLSLSLPLSLSVCLSPSRKQTNNIKPRTTRSRCRFAVAASLRM